MTIEDFRSEKKITTFYPPQRILMGPGPSDTHHRVLSAMARPTLGHLDPVFADMMEEIKDLLRYAFQTKNKMTFSVSGPGSVGMEMCFVNMIEPGDKVVVCRNGVFGSRMIENVERHGGVAVVVDDKWGEPVDPQKVEDALKQHPDAKILAFVHAETSTGVLSDAQTLCDIARRYDCLTIVDTVTSLGGSPIKVDEWGIDAIYSGSQKCLSCPPGLSPVSFSERVTDLVKNRKTKVHSWFMDIGLLLGYWGSSTRTYHHTAPTNSLYGLHESLVILSEEGLERSWARHQRNHEALKAGFETMGIRYVVDEKYRLPQLNSVYIPDGVDDKAVRGKLLDDYSLEIGAGLGDFAGKVWRFGLMGTSSRVENVVMCLNALEKVMSDLGANLKRGAAESAAHQSYAANPMP
ncbi:alanine--glyoxylate aminotransferase family protein [Nitrosomonas sp.]|uniref:pyridoxal-phosphate-dependent aminotransferase family protein n=1 Tax=Nitrosomonas sp. TaxID=42353 RepID=UPI001DC24F0B|nr:alanine--glyoxylate aminotransferase family protein [Nitrosomonas sp.]MCB1949865.1 alanine--glyoxylate aminotransferase family protein [Nitrosomonas sp.]MCP5242828.1 alanine--glyoxylate aminotransferase family protein [Burkholderiales bacterium]MDR4514415.1 alanine--glyoxylate aminotransferase family protein [Nitrosomonas sp.]